MAEHPAQFDFNRPDRCSLSTSVSPCLVIVLFFALGCGFAGAADIFDAARTGDVEKIKLLLHADSKLVNSRTEDGATPLHLAALEGHAATARLLLDCHAQVNARGLREQTPLHMAMYDGHREVAEVLLANKADVNARDPGGETALHLAAR
jgi:ankyrin repeat protein